MNSVTIDKLPFIMPTCAIFSTAPKIFDCAPKFFELAAKV